MTQALATIQSQLPAFSQEQLKLITDTVAKGATQDELKLFLYRCQNMGLDPLKSGQIYFVKYGNSPGTIVVGIDGFRSRAARTGKLSGIKREVIRDEKGQCIGARCTVNRSDWDNPAIEEVALSEYSTGKAMWAKMPETMIKKVAEAAALRMAFPDELGGTYAREEMDQAEENDRRVVPGTPGPDDGNQNDLVYKVDFGKWNQRPLEDILKNFGPEAIADYINYLEESAQKQNKPIQGKVKRFIEEASRFLAAFENGTREEDAGPWDNGG